MAPIDASNPASVGHLSPERQGRERQPVVAIHHRHTAQARVVCAHKFAPLPGYGNHDVPGLDLAALAGRVRGQRVRLGRLVIPAVGAPL